MWSNNGGIINPAPHGENPQEGHDKYWWGVHQRKGGGDIYGFIPMNSEISGMTSVGFPGKGSQPGQDLQTLCVQALEGQGRYNLGGTNTTIGVP